MSVKQTLSIGFFISIISCVPVWQYVFHQNFSVFPLGWMAVCLNYMSTFFHELGHTLAAWYYGYATIPMFDFKHGGGLAWSFGDQNYLILAFVWGGLAYGIYNLGQFRWLQITLIGLLVFNLLTFWNEDLYRSVIDFMGPGAEPIIASFFLFRAIFDLAPRGNTERYLNAIFGFGFILRGLIDAFGLLSNDVHRMIYYSQKGQHGFGDFDKISMRLDFDFGSVVGFWIFELLACLTIPFLFMHFYRSYLRD
ncbi:MAG TPA: hypothetical protein PLK94_08735 [Alphaproteobacteria bacterium]|nr:hypothetical protein [Alphaproteobacteria bacterium]HOO51356.1 hypothetical protein [Alphaproteobacteria bacterium]